MQLMMVVLPVPGPPVITSSPLCTASDTARRWFSLNWMPFFFSKSPMRWPTTSFFVPAASISSFKYRAISFSA